MFENTSMAGTGMLVLILTNLLQAFGVVNIDNSQLAKIVADVTEVVGFVLMVWGQLRRKDLTWGLWRK